MLLPRRLVLRAGIAFTRVTTRLPLTDTHNGLRVLHRRALEKIDLTLSNMAHASQLLGLISKHELSWTEAPVVIDYVDLGGDEALIEAEVPKEWAGKSLAELHLSRESGLTILAVKPKGNRLAESMRFAS